MSALSNLESLLNLRPTLIVWLYILPEIDWFFAITEHAKKAER